MSSDQSATRAALVERCRGAINELPEHVLQHAKEGKPHAEEQIVEAVLAEAGLRGPQPLLNAKQAAALLNVPKTWVLAEARRDAIPHVRLGHYVRFEAAELETWWRARSRGAWRKETT